MRETGAWLIAGLGLLLLGLTVLRRGLQALAGTWAARRLEALDGRPLSALIAGGAVTAALQSSSAATIFLVGAAGAGLLRLEAAMPAVLGANVGSAVTLGVFALPLDRAWAPLLALAGGLALLPRRTPRAIGAALAGLLGALFGLRALGRAAAAVGAPVTAAMAEHPLRAFVAGVVLTAILQSSTVAGGLSAAWLAAGQADLQAATAFLLGANVGTTLDTAAAGLLSPREGRLVAAWHVAVNAVGAALFLPAVDLLARAAATAPSPLAAVAAVQFWFNALSAAAFFPLMNPAARLLRAVDRRLFPPRA
ncbi:MAG: Na/Pi cotransporter family protein [Hydrogenibacillus schlegelii]|nr:Na/Pi cotransporter family protein [Hydrogenibacillus schlegelii]